MAAKSQAGLVEEALKALARAKAGLEAEAGAISLAGAQANLAAEARGQAQGAANQNPVDSTEAAVQENASQEKTVM